MNTILSKIVLGICIVSVVILIFVAATQLPYAISNDSEGWGSMIFRYYTAPLLGGAILGFGIIPSAILRHKYQRRIDLISIYISTIALGLLIVLWLITEPLRQWIIFGN